LSAMVKQNFTNKLEMFFLLPKKLYIRN